MKNKKPYPYETGLGSISPICCKCGETDHMYFARNSIIGAIIGIDVTPETLECLKCYYGGDYIHRKKVDTGKED